MKPRRVIVTLEIETDAPMKTLRSPGEWQLMLDEVPLSETDSRVLQVQVNVAQALVKANA